MLAFRPAAATRLPWTGTRCHPPPADPRLSFFYFLSYPSFSSERFAVSLSSKFCSMRKLLDDIDNLS